MRDAPAHEFAPALPGYPELPSINLARTVDRFEANAAFRQTMAERDRLYLAAVWAVAFIAALGFLVAADWGLTRAEREFQLQARV